jgi:hypothetical protein
MSANLPRKSRRYVKSAAAAVPARLDEPGKHRGCPGDHCPGIPGRHRRPHTEDAASYSELARMEARSC